ncbi:hypothetical protein Tco_1475121 [Tanacetum coccineum]
MIDQGVTAALAARDANRNGDDSHTSGSVFKLPFITKLVILLVTVGVREVPTMLTIRGALGQARNLLASSVEFKDTSRENAQS